MLTRGDRHQPGHRRRHRLHRGEGPLPEWQHTDEGERTVKQALRKALLAYKLHRDQELFEKAYVYIKQYY